MRTVRPSRASTYARARAKSNQAALGAFCLAVGFGLIALVTATGYASGVWSGDPQGYGYAFAHGQPAYALWGRASGLKLCGHGLTYAEGGPMLCTLGGTVIPRPYN